MDSNTSKNLWGKSSADRKQEENKYSWGQDMSSKQSVVGSSASLRTGPGLSSPAFGAFSQKETSTLFSSGFCENKMGMSGGGSSRYSSNDGSWSTAQWSGIVEGVFKEEIGLMAQNK